MSNSSRIDDLVPLLPSEIQSEIRDRFLQNRARRIIRKCQRLLQCPPLHWRTRFYLYQWPNLDHPYYSSIVFLTMHSWSPLFYVYLWYLLNTYHMPIVFSPHLYRTWRYYDFTLFDKFWFEVFNEDWRIVASGRSSMHPLNEPINKHVILIVKFNSNKPPMDNGLHEPSHFEWVTNADGSLHGHEPLGGLNIVCQTAIWRASALNTGIQYNAEDIATTPEARLQMEME